MSTKKKPVNTGKTSVGAKSAGTKASKAGTPETQTKKGGKAAAIKSGVAKAGAAVKAAAKKIGGKTWAIIILSLLLVLTIGISIGVCSCYEKRSHGTSKTEEPQAVAVSSDGEKLLSTKNMQCRAECLFCLIRVKGRILRRRTAT